MKQRFDHPSDDFWRLLSLVALVALALVSHHAVYEAQQSATLDMSHSLSVMATILLVLFAVTATRYLILVFLATFDQFRSVAELDPRKTGLFPSISVIVPAFNEGVTIRDSLASLLQVDYPDLEIIVVDDGSKDSTYLHAYRAQARAQNGDAKKSGKRIKLLTQTNAGKAEALNLGIAEASGELVVCIDGDGVIAKDALRRAAKHFEDPSVGAVAGSVRVINRQSVLTQLQALEYLTGLGLPKRAQNVADAVMIVPGPLGVFRRAAIQSVGGYEHDTYAEDFDMTLKLLGLGWRVRYDRDVCGATECPARLGDLVKQRYRWSRGILQVLGKRKASLWHPLQQPWRSLGAWFLVFESLVLPLLNVGGHCAFVATGLIFGVPELIVLWWFQLILLDTAVSSFCLQTEREQPSLILIAPLQRICYTLFIDVISLCSALDEWRGSAMSWGTLQRQGGFK
jgi:poly-beta-1,6-N-acetyl-D-glucosamine synthase